MNQHFSRPTKKLKEKINEIHPSIKVFFEFSKRCIFYIFTVYKTSADKPGQLCIRKKPDKQE